MDIMDSIKKNIDKVDIEKVKDEVVKHKDDIQKGIDFIRQHTGGSKGGDSSDD